MTQNGASISLGLRGIGLGPQAVVLPGIIQTILDQTNASGGIAVTAPQRIAVDPAGNLYVADPGSNVVWAWPNRAGASAAILAGGGSLTPAQADGGPATDAVLQQPTAVALDAAGNLYIAETHANLVRKVSLATGMISTVAGTGTAGYSGDDNAATSAALNAPAGITANAVGDLFIADTGNNVIRRVYGLGGIIVTVAGTGVAGYTGDSGDATHAQLRHPQGVTLDSTGRLFVADTGNNVIRAVDPVTQSISTVVGNGTVGFSGDGGQAVQAQLHSPSDVAVDAAGDLYIADSGNARVRKLFTQNGALVTLVGSALLGDGGDGGPANGAALTSPAGVAVDSLGRVWVSDSGNDTVRSVSSATPPLNFGLETVGGVTAGQTDSLSNIGNQSLAIGQYPAPPVPADFVLTSDPNECVVDNLAPGDECDISFAFHPSMAGPLTENAWISDNSLNVVGTRQAVELTGNGIATSPKPTTINVSMDPTTAAYGIPLEVTAHVFDATGPVTIGTVAFAVDGSPVAVAPMSTSGAAKTHLPVIPAGSHVVTAIYSPAGNEPSSTGTTPFTVTQASSQVALATSATTLQTGVNIVATATVSSSTIGVPTGTVVFMSGSTQLGTAALNTNGQTVLTTQQLTPGSNVIAAYYPGDHNFRASISSSVTVVVANAMLRITAKPASLNISAGKTGRTTLLLTPMNAFSDTVNLACVGLVRGATCQFSPPSLVFSAQSTTLQSVTLVIDPHTLTVAGIRMPAKTIPMLRLGLLLLALGAMLLPYLSRRRAAHFGWGRILLVLVCVGLGSVLGCANLAPPAAISDEVTVQASTQTQGVLASTQLQVNMGQ